MLDWSTPAHVWLTFHRVGRPGRLDVGCFGIEAPLARRSRHFVTVKHYQDCRMTTGSCILTSTSCRTARTKMSKSEFLHPIMTPGEAIREVSDGQKILINPLLATIIPCLQLSERTTASQLFASRYTTRPGPWMLLKYVRSILELTVRPIGIPGMSRAPRFARQGG